MDSRRLANIIFDKGQKIPESRYKSICESLEAESFSLDDYVVAYKLRDKFMGKIAFTLADGANVLISESTLLSLANLTSIDKDSVSTYMNSGYDQFADIIRVL